MNKQHQWLFEAPPISEGDRYTNPYTNREYYGNPEWELPEAFPLSEEEWETVDKLKIPRRTASPSQSRQFAPSVPPTAAGFKSALFQGDPDLLAVLHGQLRLGRPGDPQYPAPIKSQGTGVAKVQEALVKLGYLPSGSVDGKYGKQTYNTVLNYKRQYRILTETGYLDGIVGPKTIRHLDNALAQREVKPTVRIDVVSGSLKSSTNRLGEFESPVGSGVSIQPASIFVPIGQDIQVIATGDPLPIGSPAYTWSIADPNIATVRFAARNNSQTHPNRVIITGKAVGKTTISVTYKTRSKEITTAQGDVIVTCQSPWDTRDAESNVLRFPIQSAPTQNGSLAHLQGGLVSDSSLRPRVSIIVGPGATLLGIARIVLPLYTSATSAPPTLDELAKGILVYNSLYLPLSDMRSYGVGLRLPLPIEIDQSNGNWILNSDLIRTWASTFPANAQLVLSQRPCLLDHPDPTVLTNEVTVFLRDRPDALQRGIHLQARSIANPFEAIFFVFEAFHQLGGGAFDIALEFMNNSVKHQIELLATLTAGNAILRRLLMALNSPPQNITPNQQTSLDRARMLLRQALGISRRSLISPRELPETRQQLADRGNAPFMRVEPHDPSGGLHRMVLGRDIFVGRIGTFSQRSRRFTGIAYGGRISVNQFVNANPQLFVRDRQNPLFQPRLEIVLAISRNEGLLDAIRMQDVGILSTGIHQWSAHADLELPSLLRRFKEMTPDEFMLYFELYLLDVRGQGTSSFMLQRVEPNENRIDLRTIAQRTTFFGGITRGNTTIFATDWAARVRAASVFSNNYRVSQIREAVGRFDRILREVGNIRVNLRGKAIQLPINQVITSQRGVALILDSHINLPGFVRADLQRAAGAVGSQPNENALDREITDRYATLRRTLDTPGRNAIIFGQHLGRDHGSFTGW